MDILLQILFGNTIKHIKKDELFELNGLMLKKKAKVYSTNEFSGHGKKEDLLDSLKRFENLKSVLVNHGDEDVKIHFAKQIVNIINPPKGVAILSPKNYIRVGAYGIIKSYTATDMNFNINN